MAEIKKLSGKDLKVLFVSSSGKIFKRLPFIESQYESLQNHLKEIDYFNIKGKGVMAYFRSYKELKNKLRTGKYDIIHAHWAYAGVLCALMLKKEKLIISFLGNDLQGIYSKKYNILTFKGLFNIVLSQLLLFKADAAIVKSKKMYRWVPSYCRHKSAIIPNGVNLNKFKFIGKEEARNHLNLDQQQKFIAFLADTADYNKNFSLLQKASVLLNKENANHKILAPYPINSMDIPFYLAAADVLAFTSRLEGSPNIVKEAIAMGCPIVATNVGDIGERLGNIRGCYISTFRADDFSNKLKAALEFNNRTKAGEYLDEISEDYIANKIICLYLKVMESSTEDNLLMERSYSYKINEQPLH